MVTPLFLKTIPIPQPLVLEAGRFDEFFASRIRAATRWEKKTRKNQENPIIMVDNGWLMMVNSG